jgi:hypothetical protein
MNTTEIKKEKKKAGRPRIHADSDEAGKHWRLNNKDKVKAYNTAYYAKTKRLKQEAADIAALRLENEQLKEQLAKLQ